MPTANLSVDGFHRCTADRWQKVRMNIVPFGYTPTRTKRKAQKIETDDFMFFVSIFILAVHNPGFLRIYRQSALLETTDNLCHHPLSLPPALAMKQAVSNAEEPPLHVLSEPGVNLSAHRAPIIQPLVLYPSASAETAGAACWLLSLTNIPLFCDDVLTS